jgi:hypothetical protein
MMMMTMMVRQVKEAQSSISKHDHRLVSCWHQRTPLVAIFTTTTTAATATTTAVIATTTAVIADVTASSSVSVFGAGVQLS